MTTQADVDAIRAALQARRAGKQVTKASSGGRAVEYAQLTVAELEAALSKAEADVAGRAKRGAIRPYFL